MTTSDQEDQVEKRGTLLNDARVREQSRNGDTGTYLSHTHSELGGRFAVTNHQTITGIVSPAPPPLRRIVRGMVRILCLTNRRLVIALTKCPDSNPRWRIRVLAPSRQLATRLVLHRVMMVVQQLPLMARCPSAPGRLLLPRTKVASNDGPRRQWPPPPGSK